MCRRGPSCRVRDSAQRGWAPPITNGRLPPDDFACEPKLAAHPAIEVPDTIAVRHISKDDAAAFGNDLIKPAEHASGLPPAHELESGAHEHTIERALDGVEIYRIAKHILDVISSEPRFRGINQRLREIESRHRPEV